MIALACLLIGYGAYTLTQARYDVYPDFIQPQLKIKTDAPGLGAGAVEQLVTRPIEQALAGGVPGVEHIRSNSLAGISVVKVIFKGGADLYRRRQLVAERLARLAHQLPLAVHAPVIMPLSASIRWVMVAGLTGPTASPQHLRTIGRWLVKPALIAVPGVSEVVLYGGLVKDYQIQMRPNRMAMYGITIQQILTAAQHSGMLAAGGYIDTPNQRLVIRPHGQTPDLQALRQTVVIQHGSSVVTLGQVANVLIADEPPVGAATVNGHTAVVIFIGLQHGANLLAVTQRLDAALQALAPTLKRQGIVLHSHILRSADFITTALSNLESSLLIGAGLIVLVLSLFLGQWRTALISCLAIPTSILAAIAILTHCGYSLNTMTLGGLAIALGEVVDDAVIDVENISRRLRENKANPRPRPTWRVVLGASLEVRSAVVFATAAVIAVFLPVLGLGGLAGRFFAPMGIAYIAAVVASLFLALTLTPALCLTLLPGDHLKAHETWVLQKLKAGYGRLIAAIERRLWLTLVPTAIFALGSLLLLTKLHTGFLPKLNERNYVVHMALAPGTSLKQSIALGQHVTQALLKLPEVQELEQRAGRSNLGGDILGPQYSEFMLRLKPLTPAQLKSFRRAMRQLFKQFPSALMSYNSVLTERINETLSGFGAPVAVEVLGNNLAALRSTAAKVSRDLSRVRGATGVHLQTATRVPEIGIWPRRRALKQWGLQWGTVAAAVQTAYRGDNAARLYKGIEQFNLTVILPPQWRNHVSAIGNLWINAPGGKLVRLRQVARIRQSRGYYAISHLDGRRAIVVTAHLTGRSVTGFVAAAKKLIAAKVHPGGDIYIQFAGAARAAAKAQRSLLVHAAIAMVVILLLLGIVMGHVRNVLLLLLNLPMALAGGVWSVYLAGGLLSLGALVGFITLFGITLRNSIMLLSHYQHLVQHEKQPWNAQTAAMGAADRLPAILMTALVTALGLLPLALGSGAPGREIEGPLAQVIVGGLITATVLNLLVLPALALRFGRFTAARATA